MKIHFLFNLILAIFNIFTLKKYLHIYQLKGYNNIRYFRFFKSLKSLFFVLCLILFIFQLYFVNLLFYTISSAILFLLYIVYLKNLIKTSKTPLKATGKLSRLYIISIFILLSVSFYKYAFCLLFILTFLSPVLANLLNFYDKIKNFHFILQAKQKLKNYHTQIIAITGSNGKTSVKNILLNILSTEHLVQATPASYNTPLGIAKFINESLKKDTEFLILEYGARHKNDIKKLCNLYGADYGILTTISAQHLETFKSIKNIYFAKTQLPIFLQNKPCVYNIDNLETRRAYNEKTTNKISVSINEEADIYAKYISIIDCATHFTLTLDETPIKLKINLLGRHNITNICLATALAKLIGIKTDNIIKSILELQPIEHRLQLIKSYINIIDDSYNCSPASAKEALWVLKNFQDKKMVVTPGIIECGKEKYNINFNLGRQIAFCDYCVIVGDENKLAILNGIEQSTQFSPTILLAKSLEDVKQHFSKLNNGDALLLLNDLPDDYK